MKWIVKFGFGSFCGDSLHACLAAIILLILLPQMSIAQERCENVLGQAEELYTTGRFDEAIAALESCLPEGFSPEQKKDVYRLLGLSYLAKDYLDQAKEAVRKLLDLVPTYEADPVNDIPAYQRIVREVKEEPREEPPQVVTRKSSKKWLLFGGAALVAGGVILATQMGGASGDGGGTGPPATGFPQPPGRPQPD